MKKLPALILGLVVLAWFAAFGLMAFGQTTQPTTAPATRLPVAVFFQPARNVKTFADMGVTHFFGPEIESRNTLSQSQLDAGYAAWVKATLDAGVKCVLKNPVGSLPGNCVGVLLSVDEPNGKVNRATGVVYTAADLKPESDRLRALYPGIPIFLSLAGDKVTDVKETNRDYAAQVAYYKAFATVADVLTLDNYPKNRNAQRYSTLWPGDAVARLIQFTGGAVPVWTWIECTDQQLSPPTLPDVNREPYPDEIKSEAEYAIGVGAKGIGWFLTAANGAYKWGDKGDGRGDSYFPMVNRAGLSMAPQYAMVTAISRALTQQVIPATLPRRCRRRSRRSRIRVRPDGEGRRAAAGDRRPPRPGDGRAAEPGEAVQGRGRRRGEPAVHPTAGDAAGATVIRTPKDG
jgi:hypothetical protein